MSIGYKRGGRDEPKVKKVKGKPQGNGEHSHTPKGRRKEGKRDERFNPNTHLAVALLALAE